MADVGVRTARRGDAATLGTLQARAWRSAYAGLLPPDVLAGLDGAELAEGWEVSVTSPPSPRHKVLTAYDGDQVVGFAAFGPSADPDLDEAMDADVAAFVIDADHTRAGHGSRLLAAVVEHLRADGFSRAHIWLARSDTSLLGFLTGAGWAEDGAARTLDLRGDGEVVLEAVRLHTDLSEPQL